MPSRSSLALCSVCVIISFLTLGGQAGRAESGTAGKPEKFFPRTIAVMGEGKVNVKPDLVRLNVGVIVISPSAKEGVAENHTKMSDVLESLKEVGVPEKDIRTSNYSITYRPPHEKPGGRQKAGESKGEYHVRNMVLVTIREMEKIDAVLDAVTESGVNQIWGLNFEVEDTEGPAAKARERAAIHAKSKAEDLARLHGVRLGSVVRISEKSAQMPVRSFGRSTMAMEARGAGPISPGDLPFTTRLHVVYEIK